MFMVWLGNNSGYGGRGRNGKIYRCRLRGFWILDRGVRFCFGIFGFDYCIFLREFGGFSISFKLLEYVYFEF